MAKNEYPLNYVSQQLSNILGEMLSEYAEELEEKAEKVTQQVAQDFADKLKEVTPRSSYNTDEHIADTVKLTPVKRTWYGKTDTVYNVHYGKWQIAHLLEFGWTLKNGKRMERTPFVRPLFDNNRERYVKMYKEALSK